MTFVPTLDRVLVEPIEAETTTPGGIILSDRTQSKTLKGRVLSVGAGVYQDGKLISIRIPVGATVTFLRGAGVEIENGLAKNLLLREGDILGYAE